MVIVINGGGVGVMMSDGLFERGMKFVEFSEEINECFKKDIEEGKFLVYMSYKNLIDVIGDVLLSCYEIVMCYVFEDLNVDVFVVIVFF